MKSLNTLALAVGAALSVAAISAQAGTATATFTITARVSAKCINVSANNLLMNYDPLVANATTGADLFGTGTMTMQCTPGTIADITMSFSANTVAGQRKVKNGANTLDYTLYVPSTGAPNATCNTAAAPTAQWKDVTTGTANTDFLRTTAFANASAQTFNYCAYMPKGQSAPTGDYTDSLTATINF